MRCVQMQQDIQMKTNEIQREGRKKDKLERELRQAKADVDTKMAEIKNLQQSLEYSTGNVAKLNGDLKEQKVGAVGRFLFHTCSTVHREAEENPVSFLCASFLKLDSNW